MPEADRKLTADFMLSEFLASDTAFRRGIENTPSESQLLNIVQHLAPGMQRVRDLLGLPIIIASGYRSLALNTAIGGSITSQHMQGLAADFTCPQFGSPLRICQKITGRADVINFDQLIYEGRWVHVSFSPAPRRSVLTAHFEGGRVRYTPGLPT